MNNKRLRPNIVRGGVAIPIPNKKNYYYMKGRKHEQGGIDIGKNPRTGLEVEDGEVMHISPTEIKVFSSVPFLNGESPAEKVMKGNNPNKVFNAQERYKDVNNINDDGTKKKAEYGILDDIKHYYNITKHNINAGINYIKRKINDKEKPKATIIRLNNVSRITPKDNNVESILFNDFVENNPNNIRKAKNFKVTNDNFIGDKKIPLQHISNYYGVEDNKLKVGNIDTFNDTTEVGKLINHSENPDSIEFDRINRRWYAPKGKGFDKDNFGMGVDRYTGGNINDKIKKDSKGREYITEEDERDLRFKRIKSANQSAKRRIDFIRKYYNDEGNVTETKEALITNLIYNRGSGRTAREYFNPEDEKYVPMQKAILEGTDDEVREEINKIYREAGLANRDSLVNNFYKKRNKKRMGGLSRSKDYGSKSKPYPKVDKKDFAGKNRSYPIPTKADAVDALRLAGLHGRNDIKTKVYNKYPELRKRAKNGGVYTVTSNGKTSLRMIPSTGKRIKFKKGGIKDIKNKRTYNSLISDGIGIASNIVGSIIGYNANKTELDKMKYTAAPINLIPAKLKTSININPQLDAIRDQQQAYERQIDANTASSRVALGRKQLGRLNTIKLLNHLYGNKENIETELINRDKLNQQAVTNQNITNYNAWREKKNAFENAIIEKQSENTIGLINSINAGVQNAIGNLEKRLATENNIRAIAAANPNVNPIILKTLGVRGITNDMIESWLRAYGNKNN